jgi:hypothetical protein
LELVVATASSAVAPWRQALIDSQTAVRYFTGYLGWAKLGLPRSAGSAWGLHYPYIILETARMMQQSDKAEKENFWKDIDNMRITTEDQKIRQLNRDSSMAMSKVLVQQVIQLAIRTI